MLIKRGQGHTRDAILSQDWVDHVTFMMKEGEVGEVYEVQHVSFLHDGSVWRGGGSCYMKTSYGYTHVSLANRELIIDSDPYSAVCRRKEPDKD